MMFNTHHVALLLPHFLLLSSTVATRSSCGPPQQTPNATITNGKAIYFITNDEVNSVVALPIGPDGTLSPGTVTRTDGAGSVALNSANQRATPDALVSQGALTIAGQVITHQTPLTQHK